MAILNDNISAGYFEGRAEGIKDTAKKLREMGMPIAQIAIATGLAEEEINKL